MTKAIRVHHIGGPEVLSWEDAATPVPGPGEALVRHGAVGLNFIDVYYRTGLYPAPTPFTPGLEGAGTVIALGSGVADLKIGQRVAYAMGPLGAYAEERVIPADRLVPLPDSIPDQTAAAMMLQGMTAQYLLRNTYRIQAGQTILFHAAAGGVGLIACQWAKHLGVRLIGTAGGPAKVKLARGHGAWEVIDYTKEDFVARVRELTDGKGVPVVYDSVGADTFMKSLDCLAPRGMLVSFGQSSGAVAPFNPGLLAAKGSLYLTRPSLGTYVATRPDLLASAGELFEVVAAGAVKIEVNQTYPLAEAGRAHTDLEARKTTGSTVLTV